MTWNGVKPSKVYGARTKVEKALRGSGWKIGEFRPPRAGEHVLGVAEDGSLVMIQMMDGRANPRFILVPGDFATWWE